MSCFTSEMYRAALGTASPTPSPVAARPAATRLAARGRAATPIARKPARKQTAEAARAARLPSLARTAVESSDPAIAPSGGSETEQHGNERR